MEHLIAGASAGVVGTILGFPLDTLKTRLQTQRTNPRLGAATIALKMLRDEGIIRGFYRGVGPPLLSLTMLNTFCFSSYEFFKRQLDVKAVGPMHMEDGERTFVFDPKVMIAGTAGGPIGSLVSTPFELVKIQLQLDNVTARRYSGSLDGARTIVRESGVRALYTGLGVNTVREVVFLGTYFGMYEHTKALFIQTLPAGIAVPVAGGMSGALAWFTSFPLDVVKAQIQGQRIDKLTDTKSRMISTSFAMKQLFKTHGIVGFYSGVAPSVARAFLVSGSRFSAYEFALWTVRNFVNSEGF
mmetsp:Transcript_36360/g.79290  ORF Transcript_36360/g.79290 Transcript_36360/m.79290 type:complete len:299 (+) Transcript_36360:342-1238(+)|eukprot:CAMPEP_0118923670 /NCGR_PEP_ID=MMETSP1169-20130426/2104_1 /TAXON_ID=36882 /ORGANISM="Pyramimonas obovata, Strain CCMP722" /LENGTH=298 /DNA_ID=CAMNT_0006864687 /DNA_START=341 /DNA_END=1240 /DNA_ORIENTATION=+